MEKPSWALFVLSGAFPRGFTDLLVIIIIALFGFEASLVRVNLAGFELGSLILFVSIPPSCALASLSIGTRKLREELALLAYGGSGWQVWVRYFLRGFTCCLIGFSPIALWETIAKGSFSVLETSTVAFAAFVAGVSYTAPSLRRIRSPEFAENYKA